MQTQTATDQTCCPPQAGTAVQALSAAVCCVKGNYRKTNEDRGLVRANSGIFLIADGMGGHAGGELASRWALDFIAASMALTVSSRTVNADSLDLALLDGIKAAQSRMIVRARRQPGLEHMGTTFAGAVIANGNAYFSRVGDCRVYLGRKGALSCLTEDETIVQSLIDANVISTEEARTSPLRHCVLNQIGTRGLDVIPTTRRLPLEEDDRIILTTDGLSNVLDDTAMQAIANCYRDTQRCADELVKEALRQDSRDNVTCVVINCGFNREPALFPQ